MKKLAIHQFSPAAHKGDGITNGMFYLRRILRDFGFESEIYVEHLDKALKGDVFSYKKFNRKRKDQILFVHYSIYYSFEGWLETLEIPKIMIYHNITPPEFFEKDSFLYTMCKKGIEYLPKLADKVDGAIGDSPLNTSELQKYHFKNIATIPMLLDSKKITSQPFNHTLFDELSKEFTIIFVGRIARNKAQHDIIEVINVYRKMGASFHCYIIGGTTDESYKKELLEKIEIYDLQDSISLTGKVSDEDLSAYYRSADIFLCMSEHEGFGIPLIEAMLFDVPVIAFNSSNIKSTLAGGGILFNEKNYEAIAATIDLLRQNPAFKRAILQSQKEARHAYAHETIVQELQTYLQNYFHIEIAEQKVQKTTQTVRFLFEGPFDSSYSLALLNRYSAESFEAAYPGAVALYATEGLGDYQADEKFLQEHPKLKKMHSRAKKAMQCEVVFRNLYPPRVSGMKGELNLLNAYGWEESSFAKEYVDAFNEHLNGITVMSEYVKDVLRNNGVDVPIAVVGLGADHIVKKEAKALKLATKKSFKFLHISSCFPRKGVDVLLDAYTQAFSKKDDVTLIIKTFPNPHNTITEEIAALQQANPDAPEIILINRDLPDEEILWLYQNCDTLVAPSRGEGFGLPFAEAMLCDLPVITTGYGGQCDFATEETAWLIDYTFSKAKTHFGLFNSYWAEPSCSDLSRLLKMMPSLSSAEKAKKLTKAKEVILQHFTWKSYREKTVTFLEKLKKQKPFSLQKLKVAWVSTYNTKCGIASYSEYLLEELQYYDTLDITLFANKDSNILDENREENILRVWGNRFDSSNRELLEAVESKGCEHILINFNFAFFSMKNLAKIIEESRRKGRSVSIIFHSVADVVVEGLEASLSTIAKELQEATRLLVHTIEDLNHLKNLGCYNTALLPHGIKKREALVIQEKKRSIRIASYGFLLPHKGIVELIEAFALLKGQIQQKLELYLVNALYPAEVSQNYYEEAKAAIVRLNLESDILFSTEYLSDEESMKLLQTADLIVLPYRETNESSSAAVRSALATYRPVVCTKLKIFDDVSDVVHFMDGFSPQEMADSIAKILQDKEALSKKAEVQKRWIDEHDWRNVARKLKNHLFREHL